MVEVVGFGLAGACLALSLQEAGYEVRVVDDGKVGSTAVAAGLVNPVAGRNFEPGWEMSEAWGIARSFYQSLDRGLFHEVPILRLWRDEKDRRKFERKRERLEQWIGQVSDEGVLLHGGGWVDCAAFLQVARARFTAQGGEICSKRERAEAIWCTGAAGLISGEFEGVEHRSAKGEILTVEIPGLREERILNRGGWLIPLGEDRYRVGATYEWDGLENGPTNEGREKVEALLRTFTSEDYEVVDHQSGVRPIIERSRPVVRYQAGRGWMINGFGSKGVIYAPRVAQQFVREQESFLSGVGKGCK